MPRASFSSSGLQRIRVRGSGDNEYIVAVLGFVPQWCTCPSFEHRAGPAGEFCKHMKVRHGRRAVGVTRCVRCENWLTPEEIQTSSDQGIPSGSVCCASCQVEASSGA